MQSVSPHNQLLFTTINTLMTGLSVPHCQVVMAASSVLLVAAAPAPEVSSPYLSILINRRDLGHSFELGVDKANQNLVVSGPPAPAIGFPGTSTYYQRSYGHVTPFLAFGGYQPAQYL